MTAKWMGWTLAGAVALLVASGAQAQTVQQAGSKEHGKVSLGQMVEVRATVEAIDMATRVVKLKMEKGEERSITVGPEARNLAQVQVGDNVTVQYYESITVELKKVDKGGTSLSEKASEVRAEPGEKPGAVQVHEYTLVAQVTAIDEKAGTVTVRGPKGREVALHPEAATIKKVAVGDYVEAVYTEAIAISVSKVVVK